MSVSFSQKTGATYAGHLMVSDLKHAIEAFVDYYNHCHYNEALGNVTLVDIYYGKRETILAKKNKAKKQNLADCMAI